MIFNFLKRFTTKKIEPEATSNYSWKCKYCGGKNDTQWQPSAGHVYQRRRCEHCGWTEEKAL